MTEVHFIRRENPAEGVARIVLARPAKRNAQSPELLYEFDRALLEANNESEITCIIVAADGPDFSAGHDLVANFCIPGAPVATLGGHLDAPNIAGHYAFECEAYLGLCRRWRDLPKPVLVAAQGRTIAGGLMLQWPFDIIIAAEDATFSDPVVAFNVNGIEYFTHAYEIGHRKAREMLFTGDPLSAQEAKELGMINHVVAAADLEGFTLNLAKKIAARPPFGLRLAKESINRTLDAMGQNTALDTALALHNLGHASNLLSHGSIVPPRTAR